MSELISPHLKMVAMSVVLGALRFSRTTRLPDIFHEKRVMPAKISIGLSREDRAVPTKVLHDGGVVIKCREVSDSQQSMTLRSQSVAKRSSYIFMKI